MRVYFDNAATTPIDPEVSELMCDLLKEKFGNPSSIHSFGRETRAIIEKSRKQVAGFLNVSPSEIYFTGGGTEAVTYFAKRHYQRSKIYGGRGRNCQR